LLKHIQSVVQEPYKYKAAGRFKARSEKSYNQRCQKFCNFKHLAIIVNENYFVTNTTQLKSSDTECYANKKPSY